MVGFNSMAVLRCLDCGKCTSVCPVALYNHSLSPRRIIRQFGFAVDGGACEAVWSCLTCGLCDSRCPQEVPVSRVMPQLREQLRAKGDKPPFTRCAAMESIAAIQSQAALPQQRLDWLTDDLRVDTESKTLLFVGCLPYFDKFFAENDVNTLASAKGAIRLLNALGIEPAVLAEERCCGHDALWAGDPKTFEKLARLNLKMLAERETELIVTLCPECSQTLREDYREQFGAPDCEIKHISELLAERGAELKFRETELKVSYQDPCRLGRHQGVYDEPRAAMELLPGLELIEMPRTRASAVCCAGSWLTCGQASKKIQSDRLDEAAATGAQVLVTACPKCKIHFNCSQAGEEGDAAIEIRDLADLLGDSLI